MQVFNLENQWTTLTAVEAHLLQRLKGACSYGFWGQRRKAFCPMLHPEQLEEVWCRCLDVHADFLQRHVHLLANRFRAIGLADATVMAEHINQRMIRDIT